MRRMSPSHRIDSRAEDAMAWLLEGDPAIRWQVLRDLVGAPGRTVARERAKVARAGWGARLLALQDPGGTWGGGLYTPKWTSTTYSMLLLRDLGLPAGNRRARQACRLLLDEGLQRDGGIGFGWGRSETCVTGMVLSILSSFAYDDDRLDTIVDHLLQQQMDDGGWNCRRPRGATHSSFHTTISVLEGLRHYELLRARRSSAVHPAQQRGREFLLVHRLFRSHRTGRSIRSSRALRSRRAGTTTSSARSTTSRRSARGATGDWQRRSRSCIRAGARTVAGCCRTPTGARSTSRWNGRGRQAAGTRSARCAC